MRRTTTRRGARGGLRARLQVGLGAALAIASAVAAPREAEARGGPGDVARGPAEALADADPARRAAAVAELRSEGPSGLRAALAAYAAREQGGAAADELARIDLAIDAVAAQLGARACGLYWHTDLESAKRAAAAAERPILSLRLLGALTDELSCANSRFFRALLYRDPGVAGFLREGFILHWSSEREVPRITIDFGDGRSLVRTITGNSCHYVLDEQGRVLDAVPGLYGPAAFVEALARAKVLFVGLEGLEAAERAARVAAFHQDRLAAIEAIWARDLAALGVPVEASVAEAGGETNILALMAAAEPAPAPQAVADGGRARIPATRAMPIATGKSAVEMPMLRRIVLDPFEALEEASTPPVWAALATRHAALGRLGAASAAVVRAEAGPAHADAMVARLERSVALDTVKNELQLHRRIHAWLAATGTGTGVELADFNRRVYAELFLTPRDDAWLGLFDPETFSGLAGGGVVTEPAAAR